MDFSFGYSEDLRYNPVEYADNNFLYDIKGIYREKLNFVDKLIKSFSESNPLNSKNGSIIKISDFGIKNPGSKWLKWKDIDYIKAQNKKLKLSSRKGDIVNISYRIKKFDLIASKILKLASPLEVSKWLKQINFKPEKTISYYLKCYSMEALWIITILTALLTVAFSILNPELDFSSFLENLTSDPEFFINGMLALFAYLYFLCTTRIIVSTSIQKSSIIFYEQSLIMKNYFFPKFRKPSKSEFDISDITHINITIFSEKSLIGDPTPTLVILLFKSNGYIIALTPEEPSVSAVDPIPIYYRLKSILLDQK